MSKLHDLNDIQGQLLAIHDWLTTISERLTSDYDRLGVKKIDAALADLAGAQKDILDRIAVVAVKEPS